MTHVEGVVSDTCRGRGQWCTKKERIEMGKV